jgi:gliding motility-associated protein GldM
MSGGKETPRQKMIGMMYLVLTALLALNVSKEILNAFVVVNTGLIHTDENFNTNNQLIYKNISDQMGTEPIRAKTSFDNSKKLKTWSDELHKYVSEIKSELIVAEDEITKAAADKIVDSLGSVNNKDKYDNATRIMCGVAGDGSGKARELKEKIIAFKKNLLGILPAKVQKTTQLGLDTNDPPSTGAEKENWEMNKFYHLPVAAQITVLSQIQTEIRNAEGTVLNELAKDIGAVTIKVDKLEAQLIPSATTVPIGDEFSAKIFVAAFNTSSVPDVSVNGSKVSNVEDGYVVYKTRPSSEGLQKIKASVNFINAQGNPETSVREFEYMAVKPTAVVSPSKMNVFYIGVPNPVSISVPGSDGSKIDARLEGAAGNLKKLKDGEYEVNVTSGSKCTIPVTVKKPDGTGTTSMGAPIFRIKRIPPPTPVLLGKKSGEAISVAELKAAGFLSAILENFDFQANFQVLGFEFGASVAGKYQTVQNTSARFSDQMTPLINLLKPGSRVVFSDIKAKGPDGTIQTLSATYKIK